MRWILVAACFLTFRAQAETPYDPYFANVRETLAQLHGRELDFAHVCALVREGHSFTYRFTDPYTPEAPEVTARDRAGDCKDKALWLASKLGDASVVFVIGYIRPASRMAHAWLRWRDASGLEWVLDCTNFDSPLIAPDGWYRATYTYIAPR